MFDWILNIILNTTITAQKMKFSIKDLLNKSLMENFIFCAVHILGSMTPIEQSLLQVLYLALFF